MTEMENTHQHLLLNPQVDYPLNFFTHTLIAHTSSKAAVVVTRGEEGKASIGPTCHVTSLPPHFFVLIGTCLTQPPVTVLYTRHEYFTHMGVLYWPPLCRRINDMSTVVQVNGFIKRKEYLNAGMKLVSDNITILFNVGELFTVYWGIASIIYFYFIFSLFKKMKGCNVLSVVQLRFYLTYEEVLIVRDHNTMFYLILCGIPNNLHPEIFIIFTVQGNGSDWMSC